MKLADSIKVIRRSDGSLTFEIEGEEFPWYLSEDGVSTSIRKDEMPAITVTILAESVVVIDSLASPEEPPTG